MQSKPQLIGLMIADIVEYDGASKHKTSIEALSDQCAALLDAGWTKPLECNFSRVVSTPIGPVSIVTNYISEPYYSEMHYEFMGTLGVVGVDFDSQHHARKHHDTATADEIMELITLYEQALGEIDAEEAVSH